MSPEVAQTLDWLTSNDQYAKTIARLAGVKTAPVAGIKLGIAAYWNEHIFESPPILTAYSPDEQARLTWTPDERPVVFKLTLEKLSESFKQMMIPEHTVICHVTIEPHTKRPHFQRFFFVHGRLSPKTKAQIWLKHKDWESEELDNVVRELRLVPKQLRGMGLISDVN